MARDCDTADEVDRWIENYLNPKTILQEAQEKKR
jgi:hypothetical protein